MSGPGGLGDETDEDRQWRSIVENYGERAEIGDLGEGGKTADPGPAASRPDPAASAPDRDASAVDPWVQRHLAEEHFVPPNPPPGPRLEPPQLLAWSGVLGVPVLLILLVVFRTVLPPWGSFLMLVWFLGGFGYLVATMRRDPGEDDDRDDGAVV